MLSKRVLICIFLIGCIFLAADCFNCAGLLRIHRIQLFVPPPPSPSLLHTFGSQLEGRVVVSAPNNISAAPMPQETVCVHRWRRTHWRGCLCIGHWSAPFVSGGVGRAGSGFWWVPAGIDRWLFCLSGAYGSSLRASLVCIDM